MKLLSKLIALVKRSKRVGRGGDRGGTSGKGHKGQRARSGGSGGPVFEGGQMPLTRRMPKRGFNNARFRKPVETVSLGVLEKHFDDGAVVNRDALMQKGLIKGIKNAWVKVLAPGDFQKKLVVHVDACSRVAQERITKQGGEVHITRER